MSKINIKIGLDMPTIFLGMLTVLFIGLKLTHYIVWSWWWVLSPLWMPLSIFISFLAMGGIIYLALKLWVRANK